MFIDKPIAECYAENNKIIFLAAVFLFGAIAAANKMIHNNRLLVHGSAYLFGAAAPMLYALNALEMTANAFEEDKKAAGEAGMNGYIAKPIDIHTLLTVLETVFRDAGTEEKSRW